MLQAGCQKISRRHFLGTAAASVVTLTLDEWLSLPEARAQGRPKRSEVGTDAGQKALALYRKAVAEMANTARYPHHHPFSWQFQANIHDYPSNEPIETIFNVKGQPPADRDQILQHRAIALGSEGRVRVWRTCSHYGYPEHFLTWHRMYAYFFERIVEKIVGEPFALPYWRLTPDNSKRRMLPRAFREPTVNGVQNPLYFSERNEAFLRDGLEEQDVGIADAWRARSLLGDGRFSELLEGTPHGSVHSAVGTVKGMASVAMAARDPIFWLHHANIDRLWESWRQPDAEGRSQRDPTHDAKWMSRRFAFVGPNGKRIEMSTGDAVRARSTLGIEYDVLEGGPLVAMGVADEPEDMTPTTLARPKAPSTAQIREMGVPVVVSVAPAVAPPVALGFGEKPSNSLSFGSGRRS